MRRQTPEDAVRVCLLHREMGPAGGGDHCPAGKVASPWLCACGEPSLMALKISSCPFQKNRDREPASVQVSGSACCPAVHEAPAQPECPGDPRTGRGRPRVLGAGISAGSPSVRRGSLGRWPVRAEALCLEAGACRPSVRWRENHELLEERDSGALPASFSSRGGFSGRARSRQGWNCKRSLAECVTVTCPREAAVCARPRLVREELTAPEGPWYFPCVSSWSCVFRV